MKLSFYGADQCVTGSCHCLEVNGKRVLIDCGLQQGRDEVSNSEFPFAANTIDFVLVTHAHIDHSGRIPMLIKQGFQGRILTTSMTARLLEIMLLNMGRIQEQDAEWKNRKGERSGAPRTEPLYTVEDAERVSEFLDTCEYGELVHLCEGVDLEYVDAGHLLGSAFIAMDLTENGVKKSIVFSGDIGNINQPIIRDPVQITGADYVVMESTYGDRNHPESWGYTENLARIIDETMARGGNVVIPSFAVGRTQELLYFIREIKEQHLVKSVPDFPVYIDSPLAKAATSIFDSDLRGYMDHDAVWLVRKGTKMFRFPNLCLTESSEESKALNEDPTPKVIISASGMCDAGRIRHHLGRTLLEGAVHVKLFGEEIAVQAHLENFTGLSSHADRDHLIKWISGFQHPKPQQVFVVHGDREVAPFFAQSLTGMGIPAHAPQYTEVYDLAANTMLERGYLPERKPKIVAGSKVAPAYERLVTVGNMLSESIRRSKGRDNKSLAKFAEQLRQLLEKWEM